MQPKDATPPGRQRARPNGIENYKKAGLAMASAIQYSRGANGILYLPIESAGRSFGEPMEEAFLSLGVPYRKLSVDADKVRRKVFKPTAPEIQAEVQRLRSSHDGVLAIIYDDTIIEGNRVMTFYDFLKNYMANFGSDSSSQINDVRFAAILDRLGITAYHYKWMAPGADGSGRDEPGNYLDPDFVLGNWRKKIPGKKRPVRSLLERMKREPGTEEVFEELVG